jgi:hypothetical protein
LIGLGWLAPLNRLICLNRLIGFFGLIILRKNFPFEDPNFDPYESVSRESLSETVINISP